MNKIKLILTVEEVKREIAILRKEIDASDIGELAKLHRKIALADLQLVIMSDKYIQDEE
mgnify:CR=1 FL=1